MVGFKYMDEATLSGTAAAIDSEGDIEDRGSAEVLFPGNHKEWLHIHVKANALNVDNTLRVELVGADDEAISSNVIVIADTGVIPAKAAVADWANLQVPPLALRNQTTAKRYYAIRTTQGGTGPAFVLTVYRSHQEVLNMIH